MQSIPIVVLETEAGSSAVSITLPTPAACVPVPTRLNSVTLGQLLRPGSNLL